MKESPIQSSEFRAPFVRVRGRISRKGNVRLDYCLRTFHPPNMAFGRKRVHGTASQQPENEILAPVDSHSDTVVRLDLLDNKHTILETGYALLDFVFEEASWGAFVQRLWYKQDASSVRVSRGGRKLKEFPLVNRLPDFQLHIQPDPFDPSVDRVCDLSWETKDTPERPYKYYVRYSGDGKNWHRPAVNLHTDGFRLNLRDMPGGEACTISVIASNGYNAAVASMKPFSLRRRPAKALLSASDGPILFAQGFTLEYGPISPGEILWMIDETDVVGTSGSFDIRKLGPGIHEISVWINDPNTKWTQHALGTFDCDTGLRV
jgi:hypothetical protein